MKLEWSRRTDPGLSIVPTTNLYHLRRAWKIAVDLNPAATTAGTSTAVWPDVGRGQQGGNLMAVEYGGDATEAPKEAIAGEMLEVVVEARDAYGNHRSVGECEFNHGLVLYGTQAGDWTTIRHRCQLIPICFVLKWLWYVMRHTGIYFRHRIQRCNLLTEKSKTVTP